MTSDSKEIEIIIWWVKLDQNATLISESIHGHSDLVLSCRIL